MSLRGHEATPSIWANRENRASPLFFKLTRETLKSLAERCLPIRQQCGWSVFAVAKKATAARGSKPQHRQRQADPRRPRPPRSGPTVLGPRGAACELLSTRANGPRDPSLTI
jgi:hypothetical protein